MTAIQLDFFKEMNENDFMREEIRQMRESNEKTRKSLYARHGELAKKYTDLQNRLSILEHHICRGTVGLYYAQRDKLHELQETIFTN